MTLRVKHKVDTINSNNNISKSNKSSTIIMIADNNNNNNNKATDSRFLQISNSAETKVNSIIRIRIDLRHLINNFKKEIENICFSREVSLLISIAKAITITTTTTIITPIIMTISTTVRTIVITTTISATRIIMIITP